MTDNKHGGQDTFQVHPIGTIHRNDDGIHLEILDTCRPALKQLGHFTHVMVFWWADQQDNADSRKMMQCEPPYAAGQLTGVFATRAEYRPNPIATSTCKVLNVDVDAGRVGIAAIDAYDGSPLLDIKPYIGVVDRVEHITVPDWYEGWPEWMPEEGIGLYEDD